MNERIRELAKQAEELVDSMPVEQRWDWLNLYDQKFAELLVQECAEIATNRYQRLMDGGKAIKEHFGVE